MYKAGWYPILQRIESSSLAVGPSQLQRRLNLTRALSTSTSALASASATIPASVKLSKLKGQASSIAQAAGHKPNQYKQPSQPKPPSPSSNSDESTAQSTTDNGSNIHEGDGAKFVELASQDWCTMTSYVHKLRPKSGATPLVDRHQQLAVNQTINTPARWQSS